MANYFVCNTSKVKAVNTGGRLHSAVLTQEVPNGALVFVGGYKEGESEIRTAQLPTTALIAGKVKPMLVMKPEINASESSKADGALGIFRNPANKALPVIPLELHDEFELSQDGPGSPQALPRQGLLHRGSPEHPSGRSTQPRHSRNGL